MWAGSSSAGGSGGCSEPSLSLQSIITSFNSPITEEHAFAVVHEAMKCLRAIASSSSTNTGATKRSQLCPVEATREILVRKDGSIDEKTFLDPNRRRLRKRRKKSKNKDGEGVPEAAAAASEVRTEVNNSTSVKKIISKFGEVIFSALDFGLKENEERSLTPGLDNLLDLMTSMGDATESSDSNSSSAEDCNESDVDNEPVPSSRNEALPGAVAPVQQRHHHPAHRMNGDTDDEGIEKDHDEDDDGHMSPQEIQSQIDEDHPDPTEQVLSLCAHHLAVPSEADGHFRAVCRALFSETIELTTFLQRASESKRLYDSEELQELALQDWANLWIQTIHELRQGVKLKKTSFTKTPIEYELTPYEILMDDIRSRRYKLNKVMVDGELPPKVKKDAHDIILDFIRSRPPLKPASRRQLKPLRRYSTPAELLMESIRDSAARESLRKTSGPPEPKISVIVETASKSVTAIPLSSIEEDLKTDTRKPARKAKLASEVPVLRRAESVKRLVRPDPKFLTFDPNDDDDDEDQLQAQVTVSIASTRSLPSIQQNGEMTVVAEEDESRSVAKEEKHRTIVTIGGSSNKSDNATNSQRLMKPAREQDPEFGGVVLRRKRVQWNVGDDDGSRTSPPQGERRRHSAVAHSQSAQSPTPSSSQVKGHAGSPSPVPTVSRRRLYNSVSPLAEEPEDPTNSLSSTPLRTHSVHHHHRAARHGVTIKPHPYLTTYSSPNLLNSSTNSTTGPLSVPGLAHAAHRLSLAGPSQATPTFLPQEMSGVAAGSLRRTTTHKQHPHWPSRQYRYHVRHHLQQAAHEGDSGVSSSLIAIDNPFGSNPNTYPAAIGGNNLTPRRRRELPKVPESMLTKSKKFEQWASALQTHNLTLEEVVHIRKVLTKAELEDLALDTDLRTDLEKGKVCFLCMKTRFGLFTWSYLCQLCSRHVCSGCLTKMRLPTETFNKVPVFALSPYSPGELRRNNSSSSKSGLFRRRSMSARRRLESSSCSDDDDPVGHHSFRSHNDRPRSVSIVDISQHHPEPEPSPPPSSFSFGGLFGSVSTRSRSSTSSSSRRRASTTEEEDDEEEESSLEIGNNQKKSGGIFRNWRGGGGAASSNNQSHERPKTSYSNNSNSRVKLRRSNTTISSNTMNRSKSQGISLEIGQTTYTQANVCSDCKEMILQIIRAHRANRRQNVTRSLCLK